MLYIKKCVIADETDLVICKYSNMPLDEFMLRVIELRKAKGGEKKTLMKRLDIEIVKYIEDWFG